MSKSTKSQNVFARILTYILVVLLLLGFAGVIVYFVAKDEGVSFYVEYDGQRYYSGVDNDELFLRSGEPHNFSVKSLTGNEVDYSVSILSCGNDNFTFVYDGEFYDFYSADNSTNNDYSSVFDIQKDKSGFTLLISDGTTVESLIEQKFGGDILLQDNLQSDVSYFVITVSDGENVVALYFSFGTEVEGITFDKQQIVF